MDTDGILGTVMEIMVGAASGVGSGVGTAVAELVRERLTASDEGRTALTSIADNPSDAARVSALRALLERELEADSQFRTQLAGALAGPPPPEQPLDPQRTTTHSVVISGSNQLRNNQISLGPLTINNTRSAKALIIAVIALVAVLMVLAGYGVVRVIGGDGATTASTGSRGDGDAKTVGATRTPAESIGAAAGAASDACVAAGGTPPRQTPVAGRVGANPCVLPVGATYTYEDGVTIKVTGFEVIKGNQLDGKALSVRQGEEAFIVSETVTNKSAKPLDLFQQFSYVNTISASTGETVNTVESTVLTGPLAPGASATRQIVMSINPVHSGSVVRFSASRDWTDSAGRSPYDLAWVGTVTPSAVGN